MSVLTNDTAELEPRTSFPGPALEFDFPALRIGVAEYAEGPTGCTVFYFPAGAMIAVDVRGGAVGTMMTEEFMFRHAICLSGGSLYGLEAAAGVAAELFAQRGHPTAFDSISLVCGAVIYDFTNLRDNAIYPDKALGREAIKAARPGLFPLGPRGAGASASVGKVLDRTEREAAGQGAAFRQIGQTKVLVCSVVNACGAIVDRRGQVVRGHLDRSTGNRVHVADDLEARLASDVPASAAMTGNTTLSVVVTNQQLSQMALRQMSRQIHSSMARAIQPFHTMSDGDVLYAVTTNEVSNESLDELGLGVVASELAWDAVLASFDRES